MSELDTLIQLLGKLPGLGPRSARRAALFLIKRREQIMEPLAAAMAAAAAAVRPCTNCGNLDTADPCAICRDPERDQTAICVVEDLADLWALERTGAFRGRYKVLGGTLSDIDVISPTERIISRLIARRGPRLHPQFPSRRDDRRRQAIGGRQAPTPRTLFEEAAGGHPRAKEPPPCGVIQRKREAHSSAIPFAALIEVLATNTAIAPAR